MFNTARGVPKWQKLGGDNFLEIFWKHLWKIVGKILEKFLKFLENSWKLSKFSKILEKLSRFSKNSWKIIEIFGKFLKIIQIFRKLLKNYRDFRKILENFRKSLSKTTEFSIIGWGSPLRDLSPPRSGHPWIRYVYAMDVIVFHLKLIS